MSFHPLEPVRTLSKGKPYKRAFTKMEMKARRNGRDIKVQADTIIGVCMEREGRLIRI